MTGRAYDAISTECKQQFNREAKQLLNKVLADARSQRLKQIVEEIRNDGNIGNLNPEIVAQLLQTEL